MRLVAFSACLVFLLMPAYALADSLNLSDNSSICNLVFDIDMYTKNPDKLFVQGEYFALENFTYSKSAGCINATFTAELSVKKPSGKSEKILERYVYGNNTSGILMGGPIGYLIDEEGLWSLNITPNLKYGNIYSHSYAARFNGKPIGDSYPFFALSFRDLVDLNQSRETIKATKDTASSTLIGALINSFIILAAALLAAIITIFTSHEMIQATLKSSKEVVRGESEFNEKRLKRDKIWIPLYDGIKTNIDMIEKLQANYYVEDIWGGLKERHWHLMVPKKLRDWLDKDYSNQLSEYAKAYKAALDAAERFVRTDKITSNPEFCFTDKIVESLRSHAEFQSIVTKETPQNIMGTYPRNPDKYHEEIPNKNKFVDYLRQNINSLPEVKNLQVVSEEVVKSLRSVRSQIELYLSDIWKIPSD